MTEEKLREIIKEIVIEIINEREVLMLQEGVAGKCSIGGQKGECTVVVYPNEGIGFPHFHIETNAGKKENVCIGLYEAKYYKHSHGEGVLSSTEMKNFIKWLDKECEKTIEINNKKIKCTNWQFLAYDYDRINNTNFYDYKTSVRPAYKSNMPDMKDK